MFRIFIVSLAFVFVQSAVAATIVSMNPGITGTDMLAMSDDTSGFSTDVDAALGFDSSGYSENGDDPSNIKIKKENLTRGRWLFGAMIEAASSPHVSIALGADMKLVRFAVEQSRLVIYEDDPNVPEAMGATENIINRYECSVSGENLFWNLTKPEISEANIRRGNLAWQATSGGQVYDLSIGNDYIGWLQKFIFISTEGNSETETIFIRFFFKRYKKSQTYKMRPYTNKDMKKYGYFRSDVSKLDKMSISRSKSVINRLDLSKKQTFYLHPLVPDEYRESIREGILSWNKLFKASNGVSPIEVLDGESWMLPSDIRYKVFYWVDHMVPGYESGSAYGPSTVDPLTGEIIDCDVVMFGRGYVKRATDLFEKNLKEQNSEQDEEKGEVKVKESAEDSIDNTDMSSGFEIAFSGGTTLAFNPRGQDPKVGNIDAEMVAQLDGYDSLHDFICAYIKGIACHEVGHNLGLRHNFSGSVDSDNFDEGQISTSIMEYLEFSKMTEPGNYDYAAIAYGYDGDESIWKDKTFKFFTDGDVSWEPDCNRHDEGDPFLYYSKQYDDYEAKLASWVAEGYIVSYGYLSNILSTLRKYVGFDHSHSVDAFAFFFNRLIKDPESDATAGQLAHNASVRTGIARILLFPGKGINALSYEQKDRVIGALSHAITNDCSPFKFRLNSIKTLDKLQLIEAQDALEKAKRSLSWKKVRSSINVFEKSSREKKNRNKELSIRLEQCLGSYFKE